MRKQLFVITTVILMVSVLVQCTKKIDATTDLSALPQEVSTPANNPQTSQKIALGKMLFWDPILSGNKDIACATCHHPSFGYSDGLDLSIGVNGQGLGTLRHFISPNNIPFAKRNSLSIINTAFNGINNFGISDPSTAAMFFDNRTHSLELQSLEPIKSMEEMKGTRIASSDMIDTVVARLKSVPVYFQLFNAAFTNGVTSENMGKAIASYERTIISNQSPFDRYMRGDKTALTATQVQGMNLFSSNGCIRCHNGPMLSDYSLHVLSVPDNAKVVDTGANGSYAFRTPSLRNLAYTAPYMHNGAFPTLDAVLDFYEQVGDRRSQNPHVSSSSLDPNLRGINGRDKASIIQFLNALNDGSFDKTVPTSVPSGLHPGGNL